MKKLVFYFIALIVTLIYANIPESTSDLSDKFLSGIPFGIIAIYAVYIITKKDD